MHGSPISRIARDFRASVSDEGMADCVEWLLNGRADFLGCPDPTLWRSGDVHRLLFDLAVPRLMDLYGLSEHGTAAIRAYLTFLDARDRFHPGSTTVRTLFKELDKAEPKFPAALLDRSRWRLAKCVFTAMRADGVDIQDAKATDRWATKFSRSSAQRHREVLGDLLDRQPELGVGQFVLRDGQVIVLHPGARLPPQLERQSPQALTFPAVSLPSPAELAAAVGRSQLLHRLVALAHWAGTGRKVTKTGELALSQVTSVATTLKLPDTLVLHRAWNLALETELLQLRRVGVVAGPRLPAAERALAGEGEPDEALGLWAEVFHLKASGDGWMRERENPEIREWLAPWGHLALGAIYRAGRPMTVDDLVQGLVADNPGVVPDDGRLPHLMATYILGVLFELSEHAAITLTGDLDAEVGFLGQPTWVADPPDGLTVNLTALGRYALREDLIANGVKAPLLSN
jgi:hypothetical protein